MKKSILAFLLTLTLLAVSCTMPGGNGGGNNGGGDDNPATTTKVVIKINSGSSNSASNRSVSVEQYDVTKMDIVFKSEDGNTVVASKTWVNGSGEDSFEFELESSTDRKSVV